MTEATDALKCTLLYDEVDYIRGEGLETLSESKGKDVGSCLMKLDKRVCGEARRVFFFS